MAQVVAIKSLRQDPDPEHIDPEEHRQGEKIKIDQLHHNFPLVIMT
jgi:hypothetical protein